MADNLLDCLLSAAADEIEGSLDPQPSFDDTLAVLTSTTKTPKTTLTDISADQADTSSAAKVNLSTIHTGDTDSSDDEDNRDFENRKYNQFGTDIKHLLDAYQPDSNFIPKTTHQQLQQNLRKSTWKVPTAARKPELNKAQMQPSSESLFGIRVIKPLVSSKTLEQRLVGREVVPLSRIKMFVRNVTTEKDWVIAGVIVHKSTTKTSQKGKSYCIWTISDLKADLKTVSVFLFGSAFKELWKTVVGTVIGILNPFVMDQRDGSRDEAYLSLDNHQRVMILGQSKDMGTCKSIRKSGERCTAFVNLSTCEFCLYHIKQEYQKCSKRSELQANFAGGGLTALRNKVLGKDQVFYAGKLYTAIPAKRNKKQVAKDEGRLRALAGYSTTKVTVTKNRKQMQAARLELAAGQRQRDLERLRQLGINGEVNFKKTMKFDGELSRDVSVEDSKNLALSVIKKLKKGSDSLNAVKGKDKELVLESSNGKNQDELLSSDDSCSSKGSSKQNNKNQDENFGVTFSKFDGQKKMGLNTDLKSKTRDAFEKTSNKNSEKDQVKPRENLEDDSAIRLNIPEIKKTISLSKELKNQKENTLENLKCKNKIQNEEDNLKKLPLKQKANQEENSEIVLDKYNSKNTIDLNIDFKYQKQDILGLTKAKNYSGNEHENSKIELLKQKENLEKKIQVKQNKYVNNNSTDLNADFKNLKQNISGHQQDTKHIFKQLPEANKSFASTQNSKHQITSLAPNKAADMQSTTQALNLLYFTDTPSLSGSGKLHIDLSAPIQRRQASQAKQNALIWVQTNGPIKKQDPNSTRGTEKGKKRMAEALDSSFEPKKSKTQESEFFSKRFKKMMAATSSHTDLLEERDNEEQEKYFQKLEMKERMEEKMLTTYKVPCKAVKCQKCKYTNFSASDLCKAEKHPLRVFDAMKRFFKCHNCGNRVACLVVVPTTACKNCGSSQWERTSMMKERKVEIAVPRLSIRGGEQKFVNSVVADSNLDLLVPE